MRATAATNVRPFVPPPVSANEAFSEDSVALGFVQRHAENLRFDHDRKRWYVWNDVRWQEDGTAKAYSFARDLSRIMAEDESASVQKGAGRAAFAAGVERLAQADQRIAITGDLWDADPYLLGTKDGVVDLRDGSVMRPRREDHITKLAAVAPAERADCPMWLKFLDQATGGDADLIRFLQQWFGYSLTGITTEHQLVFLHGPGGNGKGVFMNTLGGILGDYAKAAGMDTFMAAYGDRHPEELATLRGARTVFASETEEGRRWAEARVKALTGGDAIRARFMRQDSFEFTPTFKLTFAGNHAPAIQNLDDAIKRRFNIIPFTRAPARVDVDLGQKLRREWPSILRWAIDGCLDWQKNGLVRANSITSATQEYFDDQDVFATWMDEHCDQERENTHKFEGSGNLFANWKDYAKRVGEEPGSIKTFASRMQRRGYQSTQIKALSGKGYRGINLKNQHTRNDQ